MTNTILTTVIAAALASAIVVTLLSIIVRVHAGVTL